MQRWGGGGGGGGGGAAYISWYSSMREYVSMCTDCECCIVCAACSNTIQLLKKKLGSTRIILRVR